MHVVCFKILLATCIFGQQNKKTKQELDIHFPWENNTGLQARRPRSVTRGGGAEKLFGGAQINFTLVKTKNKTKKKFSTWPLTFFRGTSLARGGTSEFNDADLASCPQI